MNERVVLVPGLWMPAVAMAFLGAALARGGFRPVLFSYDGRGRFDRNADRLATFARGEAFHFIGHSLGGVLILEALSRHGELPAASSVFIGSPVRGCEAGRRFGEWRLGRWMMGACAPLWAERTSLWPRPAPLGVIAGTFPLGLGRVVTRLAQANDGVVQVSETTVEGMRERVLVPLGHSRLIFSRRVAVLAARFLKQGTFEE